ncbi:MAG TPA: hypothetical protein PKN87_08690 [Syntrophomonadaceae bacterium]|nr:hypothetical protein [Syntrophomonadaceae bacterium]HPR93796.1 hypothetical protein [Syntrophomonadaceae bacterium]
MLNSETNLTSFEAVYYASPSPTSLKSLTLLALVFDKIYFPGVYIPTDGIDEDALVKQIQRSKSLGRHDLNTVNMINCMVSALNYKYLKEFCIFTGQFGGCGLLEDGTREVSNILEEMIYGPPPPNFTPTFPMGFSMGLAGDETASINGPSWITYPTNALIFSTRNQIPLINDNPALPIPSLGNADVKSNAKLLATILALESVKLALPNLKSLTPEQIVEFRHEFKEYIKPFRLSMLRLSSDLNGALHSGMELEDVQNEAKFLVETKVYPDLEELKEYLSTPSKPWYSRLFDNTKNIPELVVNLFTMPTSLVIAQLLSKISSTAVDIACEKLDRKYQTKQSGYAYLLKIGSM